MTAPHMDTQILVTESSVRQYLQNQYVSASMFDFRRPNEIMKIKGGTTNFTYRLTFANPQAHHSSGQVQDEGRHIPSAILKFAAEYATNDPSTPFSSERQLYEVRAMQQLASALTSQPDEKPSLIKVPELYHFDENAHVIIMEDVSPPVAPSVTGDVPVFVSLEKMCQKPVGDNALEIVDQVGTQLGQFLFRLHRYTYSEPDPSSSNLKELFLANEVSKEIDVQTCFRDIPRKLKEFDIVLDPTETARLNEIIADMVSDYLERPQSIIMGDFWFGNMILKLSGAEGRKTLEEISIIDWEFVTCAPSYVDLAHFLSEIWLQDRFFPGPSPAALVNRQAAIATFKSYLVLGGRIDHRRLACYVGGHSCCFLDFMGWNNEDGLKRTVAKEGAVMMLQADAGEWDELFKNSSFMETLLKLDSPKP